MVGAWLEWGVRQFGCRDVGGGLEHRGVKRSRWRGRWGAGNTGTPRWGARDAPSPRPPRSSPPWPWGRAPRPRAGPRCANPAVMSLSPARSCGAEIPNEATREGLAGFV